MAEFEPWSPEGDSLLEDLIEAVMTAIAGAFRDLWHRPGASELVQKFLDGNATFAVDRNGIAVLEPADE